MADIEILNTDLSTSMCVNGCVCMYLCWYQHTYSNTCMYVCVYYVCVCVDVNKGYELIRVTTSFHVWKMIHTVQCDLYVLNKYRMKNHEFWRSFAY